MRDVLANHIGFRDATQVLRMHRHRTIGAEVHKKFAVAQLIWQNHTTQSIGVLVASKPVSSNERKRRVNIMRILVRVLVRDAAECLSLEVELLLLRSRFILLDEIGLVATCLGFGTITLETKIYAQNY